jgi:hypothetical protein
MSFATFRWARAEGATRIHLDEGGASRGDVDGLDPRASCGMKSRMAMLACRTRRWASTAAALSLGCGATPPSGVEQDAATTQRVEADREPDAPRDVVREVGPSDTPAPIVDSEGDHASGHDGHIGKRDVGAADSNVCPSDGSIHLVGQCCGFDTDCGAQNCCTPDNSGSMVCGRCGQR